MNIKWNAENYTENFQFVHRYGEDVMELLQSPAGSTVLDLGCGNGNLTSKLKERGYQVIGMDDSEDMLRIARANYPEIDFRKGNALSFQTEPVDAVFSNAVLHWIDREKQGDLLKNIAANIRNGGELVCEFGGYGCAEKVHSTLEKLFAKRGFVYPRTFYFPTIGEYAPMLEDAGLRVKYAVLFDRPTLQNKGLEGWIRMFDMAAFAGIDEETVSAIIREAGECLRPVLCQEGSWYVDYVRIRFRCEKEYS